MFYVYILKLKTGNLYIGYTNNLERRLSQHKNGESTYTKPRRPLKLVYYEAYLSKKDAIIRERRLKQFKNGHKILINRVSNSIRECVIN